MSILLTLALLLGAERWSSNSARSGPAHSALWVDPLFLVALIAVLVSICGIAGKCMMRDIQDEFDCMDAPHDMQDIPDSERRH